MSLVSADRGSMHVVEHHDDVFSWKKYNDYLYVNNVCQVKNEIKENVVLNNTCISIMFSLCWPEDSVVLCPE
jgi:hypothetical protein